MEEKSTKGFVYLAWVGTDAFGTLVLPPERKTSVSTSGSDADWLFRLATVFACFWSEKCVWT